jgi:GWxTD domain-containing protein
MMLLALTGLSLHVIAQVALPAEPLRLSLDFTRFRGADDAGVLVEMAYAFPQRSLTYHPDSVGISGAADILLTIRRQDSVVYQDRWLVPHAVKDTAHLTLGMNLVGVYKLQLPEGEYIVTLLTRDRNNTTRYDSLSLRLPVRVFVTQSPVLSDIQLANIIRRGSKESIFYKNTLDVIPNVGGLYTDEQSCYYYAEAYNLVRGADTTDYLLRTGVYDAVGKEIISREKPKRRVGESSVLVDQFPVGTLRSGTYTLMLALLDTGRTVLNSSARKFFVYNTKLGLDTSLVQGSRAVPMAEYMSLDVAELDREFEWCRYLSTDDERSQFEQLTDVDAKRKFMSSFWRNREVGLREEYLARVAFANANFNVLARAGYRTDRGRVVIMYGHPDDVERHPNETDSRPYEIWYYNNIQGGVQFVFVQRNQAGDYELVHSTHRNELHDPNWDRVGITR